MSGTSARTASEALTHGRRSENNGSVRNTGMKGVNGLSSATTLPRIW